jgi:four helix bundle protein
VIKDFRDLEVYQLSNGLSIKIYGLTSGFPKEERFGITDQLRRASASVGANIAEGSGRFHTKDYIKFLYNSRGSLMEVQHFIILSTELGFASAEISDELTQEIKVLSIKLNNLIGALSQTHTTRSHKESQGVTNERQRTI